jgi:hypothetical protein
LRGSAAINFSGGSINPPGVTVVSPPRGCRDRWRGGRAAGRGHDRPGLPWPRGVAWFVQAKGGPRWCGAWAGGPPSIVAVQAERSTAGAPCTERPRSRRGAAHAQTERVSEGDEPMGMPAARITDRHVCRWGRPRAARRRTPIVRPGARPTLCCEDFLRRGGR